MHAKEGGGEELKGHMGLGDYLQEDGWVSGDQQLEVAQHTVGPLLTAR
jgi:hypothetical protein